MIGETFGDEIIAAGLQHLPFTWDVNQLYLTDDRLTDQNKADIQAVLTAHNPARRINQEDKEYASEPWYQAIIDELPAGAEGRVKARVNQLRR